MPALVLALLLQVIDQAGDVPDSTLEDEEYRKRLQDKFGNRWLTRQLVQAREDETNTCAGTPTNEIAEVVERQRERTGTPSVRKKRKRAHRVQVIRLRSIEGGSGQLVERQVAVDMPKFRYVDKNSLRRTGTSRRGCRTIRMDRRCS
jgi:hypothetical protein